MNRLHPSLYTIVLLMGVSGALAQGPVLPLEIHQKDTPFNFQSGQGVPITGDANDPGSDGDLDPGNESTGVFTTPTAGVFGGFVSFGAGHGLKRADWETVSTSAILNAGITPFDGEVAGQMRLPRAESGGQVHMIMRRAQIGAPFLSRQVSFGFGAVIAPPEIDETGAPLGTTPNTAYWLPEPYTADDHEGAGYYWSPHARQVYAIQPGPITITWRKAAPYPAGNLPAYTNEKASGGVPNFQIDGANAFLLYTENYIVSGSAVQRPRRMYWTEKGFRNTGVPIRVPPGRVGAVNVVYQSNFPRTVSAEYVGVGSTSPADGSGAQTLEELRTLWWDQRQGIISAYNAEGRVFVELLGDLRTDGATYKPLGFEIVDVSKQPFPADVTIELGERITPPGGAALEDLFPQPLTQLAGSGFAHRHNVEGTERAELYATRETLNLNDYLVHWLEEGQAALRWPRLFGRYELVWPDDAAKYSHYVRPAAATDSEAASTAVALDSQTVPFIEYQDPLDRPRAKFTSDFKFYTWLDARYPVHRTLLRFVSGENIAFERVFSWLDDNLRDSDFVGGGIASVAEDIATGLTVYDPDTGGFLYGWNPATGRFEWSPDFGLPAPRVVDRLVDVGERIEAPPEAGAVGEAAYLAGHLNLEIGTSYNPNAYADPFAVGFEAANLGAIIPVNAIPGANNLEVWWFRKNGAAAGHNAANSLLGFKPIYWPTVVGRYTLQWPANPREIVLASKLGGTGLSTSEALGTIYVQNDPNQLGANPNEEHAIMSGGTPFATRDDLNITTPGPDYSSDPFVLVEYQETDGRPAMSVFKVLREKPEEGFVFDYIVPAGQLLQPPPPLTFLAKPVEGSGDNAVNYNTEPAGGNGDLPVGWTPTDATRVYRNAGAAYSYGHYEKFTYRDRKEDFWVYRGLHAGLPVLEAGAYDAGTKTFGSLPDATAVVDQSFRYPVHVSRQDEFLSMSVTDAPDWLSVQGLVLQGTPEAGDEGNHTVNIVVRDLYDQDEVTLSLDLTVLDTGATVVQAPLELISINNQTGTIVTFTDRPPFLGNSPTPANSFTMRFYYRTEPSFAWPGVPNPPAAGSIVPYLRPYDTATMDYVGDPANKATPSLDIVYRPVWPVRDPKDGSKPVPTLPFGATLNEPAFGLPGVRDFKTAVILYQQSIAADFVEKDPSAILHDPTRAKYADIETHFPDTGKIPSSVQSELYQGKIYFPDLPPHLVERVFVDPNRGGKGSLGLIGEYKRELLGESYLQLNVLRGSDLAAVIGLCPTADAANFPKWSALVNALASPLETFHEDLPGNPGTYVPDPAQNFQVLAGDLAVIRSDNTAVDSYALSAAGPGSGYVVLLAAGYLNDLYMLLGGEAWADAANPTIGIGTADNTYGDIATALFAFKGQTATLLEEELTLLRGRDDVFLPGVEVAPVYNRLVWNYTRGIDAGEVIYALNYNIQENPDQEPDGVINAEDAARMFPQGHGDAYGHYLTALKGYYSLLMNEFFDWVPRIEAVNVLGQPVSVDYQDERKFAAAAAAAARAGRQVFDLTWRQDYESVQNAGWDHFSPTRENTRRTYDVEGTAEHPVRHWGMDHWASRSGQGTYLNWVVGNAILPDVDPIDTHEGIQKVDRTTVPELKELVSQLDGLQTAMDNAEGGLSPLGLPEDALAFDVNPNDVVGPDGGTHFEQIYRRATLALNNAVVAFNDAKDVTRLLRSEQDSLADLQNQVVEQELAYRNALIELYGTPYPDDIGPGKTWKQNYKGPDTIHYMYVETPEIQFPSLWNYPGPEVTQFDIDLTDLPADWGTNYGYTELNVSGSGGQASGIDSPLIGTAGEILGLGDGPDGSQPKSLTYHLGSHGFFDKPSSWSGRRASPGRIQEAISQRIAAHFKLRQALWDQLATKASLDRLIGLFHTEIATYEDVRRINEVILLADIAVEVVKAFSEFIEKAREDAEEEIVITGQSLADSLPKSTVVGTATGGDLTFAGRAAVYAAGATFRTVSKTAGLVKFAALKALEVGTSTAKSLSQFYNTEPRERNQALRDRLVALGDMFEVVQAKLWTINEALREYDNAKRNYSAALAEADRILEEREVFRQRSAALVQGYRTRDAAFRIFRNEKLERYKTLFDLASRYALLAANAYDYETGLLDTGTGRDFTRRIINSRALGVVNEGEPQFAGSNTGDPGLSSALAEMKADWEVLRGRLGFNNPDAYTTTVSLRLEGLRILPGAEGEVPWQDFLEDARKPNILEDADVRRYCMQIGNGNGLPVPGLIVTFKTVIADGVNLFGQPLGAWDSTLSPSSFATKLFGVGVALEGYRGMEDPDATGEVVEGSGGESPGDPDSWFLDPHALARTPYVYLIPVGVDSMRTPPLGDTSEIRSWSVNDVAIPMPFNIGASDYSTRKLFQSADSLTEPLFGIRKHQAFRPVSSDSIFNTEIYADGGAIARSQYTNNRLIGRSAWNSQWKLVIPGKTLLNDPNEGLDRFIQTVEDIKLHLVTYSYSGN